MLHAGLCTLLQIVSWLQVIYCAVQMQEIGVVPFK